jgi:hypothetical protein
LPDVALADLLRLHDRRILEFAPTAACDLPGMPVPGADEDKAAHRAAVLALAAALRSALPAPCEVFAGVVLERGRDGRRDHVDLLARSANRVGAGVVAWTTDHRDVAHLAWPSLVVSEDLAGSYVRVAVWAPVSDWARTHLERNVQGRAGGRPRTRVFGQAALERCRAGDHRDVVAWME